jgi:hypothetical protein
MKEEKMDTYEGSFESHPAERMYAHARDATRHTRLVHTALHAESCSALEINLKEETFADNETKPGYLQRT